MSYPDELLKQAGHLARLDPRRPTQANLRRGVSSAYYAAFHLLTDAAARQFVRGDLRNEREAVRRSISHDDLRRVCSAPRAWTNGPLPPDLTRVLQRFERLQEARHDADYSLLVPLRRSVAIQSIADAKELMEAWTRISTTPQARAFLVALVALRGFRRL